MQGRRPTKPIGEQHRRRRREQRRQPRGGAGDCPHHCAKGEEEMQGDLRERRTRRQRRRRASGTAGARRPQHAEGGEAGQGCPRERRMRGEHHRRQPRSDARAQSPRRAEATGMVYAGTDASVPSEPDAGNTTRRENGHVARGRHTAGPSNASRLWDGKRQQRRRHRSVASTGPAQRRASRGEARNTTELRMTTGRDPASAISPTQPSKSRRPSPLSPGTTTWPTNAT